MKKVILLVMLFVCVFSAKSQSVHIDSLVYTKYYLIKPTEQEVIDFYNDDWVPGANSIRMALDSSFSKEVLQKRTTEKGSFILIEMYRNSVEFVLWQRNEFSLAVLNMKKSTGLRISDLKNNPIGNARVIELRKNKNVLYDTAKGLYLLNRKRRNIFMVNVDGDIGIYNISYWNNKKEELKDIKKEPKLKTRKHEGYATLSQMKYKPGDTLRFSSFIVKKGKPYVGPLSLEIYESNGYYSFKSIFKKVLPSNQDGIYTYEMQLPDSFRVDKDYRFKCYIPDEYYDNMKFRIVDYELEKTSFNCRVLEHSAVNNILDSAIILVEAMDVNGFTKYGSKIEVLILPDVTGMDTSSLVVPDTLFMEERIITTDGVQKIYIPDSLLNLFKGELEIQCKLTTPVNEVFEETKYLIISDKKSFLNFSITDSLRINYYKDGKNTLTKAKLIKVIQENSFEEEIELPFVGVIEPQVEEWKVEAKGFTKEETATENLRVVEVRQLNKLKFQVYNWGKMPIGYTVYKNAEIVQTGKILQEMDSILVPNPEENIYYLEINYLWAGKYQVEKLTSVYQGKTLTLEMEQPDIVFPGKTTEIKIKAKKANGEPAINTRITAFSVNENLPENSQYNLYNFNKKAAWFKVEENTAYILKKERGMYLSNAWMRAANLQNNLAFKHYNPEDSLLVSYLKYNQNKYHRNEDSLHGQLSCLVYENSGNSPLNQIYIDGNLRFDYNLKTQNAIILPYGFHNLKIRTAKYLYFIDSILIKPGHKTLISFDEVKNTSIRRVKKGEFLRGKEIDNAKRSFAGITNSKYNPVIIESKGNETWFLESVYSENTSLIGPFKYGDLIEFKMANGKVFKHYFSEWKHYYIAKDGVYAMPHYYEREKKLESSFWGINYKINDLAYGYQSLAFEPESKKVYYQGMPQVENGIKTVLYSKGNKAYILEEIESKKRFFITWSTRTLSLNKGNYRVYGIREEYGLKSSVFTVKEGGTNHIRVNYVDTISSEKVLDILEDVEYESVIKKFLSSKKGILFKLNDLNGKDLTGSYLKFFKGDSVYSINVDEKGQFFMEMEKGDTVKFLPVNICDGVEEIGQEYAYLAEDSIQHEFIEVSCKTDVLDLSKVDNESSLQYWTPFYHRIPYYDNSNLFPQFLSRPGERVTSFRPLRCPDFGSSENDKAFKFYSSLGSTGAISIRGSRTDATAYYVDGVRVVRNKTFSEDNLGEMGTRNVNQIASLSGGVVRITKHKDPLISGGQGLFGVKSDMHFDWLSPAGSIFGILDSVALNYAMSGLRDNFTDMAYWQPALITDENGEATFTVTYPDDIATWRTKVLAMDLNYNTGISTSFVKSYKPLMAQLHTPRFMIAGDSVIFKAELSNFTGVEKEVLHSFTVDNSKELLSSSVVVENSLYTSVPFRLDSNFEKDKLMANYSLLNSENYRDGETREIPVFAKGILVNNGQLFTLHGDTTCTISNKKGSVLYLRAEKNTADYLLKNLEHVIHYAYNCNEQVASKLRALLVKEKEMAKTGERFAQKRLIRKHIKHLELAQHFQGSWSWWASGKEANIWMSCYVTRALFLAQKAGYDVSALEQAQTFLLLQMKKQQSKGNLALILNTLLDIEQKAISSDVVDSQAMDSLDRLILSYRFKLLNKEIIDWDELLNRKHQSVLGNVYWGKDTLNFGSKHIRQTCEVYNLLKKGKQTKYLNSIQNYLLEKQQPSVVSALGTNTYESTWILETIIEDIPVSTLPSVMELDTGDGHKTVAYGNIMKTTASNIKVKYSSSSTAYLNVFETNFEPKPMAKDSVFDISVRFMQDGKPVTELTEGIKVEMVVEINANNYTNYVMFQIPIPAGCSYSEEYENDPYSGEHREQYAHQTNIYKDYLPAGLTTFTIELIPRYSGEFTLNPAKGELMYFPVINGNNTLNSIQVKAK